MSYEPNIWKSGDVVTSEKLNHIEQGIAAGLNGVLICTVNSETNALDHTWQEIANAAPLVWLKVNDYMYEGLFGIAGANEEYMVAFSKPYFVVNTETPIDQFIANSADEYPISTISQEDNTDPDNPTVK